MCEPKPTEEQLGALPWRTGTKNQQTVYDANSRQVASAQTGELARRIVQAVNGPDDVAYLEHELADARLALAELRQAIERVAESIEKASTNQFASGADARVLEWASKRVRGLLAP